MSIATPGEYWQSQQGDASAGPPVKVEYATVIQLTHQGEPILVFDGGTLPSMKTYRRMRHYSPAVRDRVQLINGIIIGGWQP